MVLASLADHWQKVLGSCLEGAWTRSPIKEGFFVTGKLKITGASGKASLAIPISGPKGKATIHVDATKSAGQWNYSSVAVKVHDTGERISLEQMTKPTN